MRHGRSYFVQIFAARKYFGWTWRRQIWSHIDIMATDEYKIDFEKQRSRMRIKWALPIYGERRNTLSLPSLAIMHPYGTMLQRPDEPQLPFSPNDFSVTSSELQMTCQSISELIADCYH